MIKLSEFIDESDASDEAKRLGLTHMGWGRYGKDRKVTHISKNGKLVPADQKVGEPHPSHGAAVRNVTRGRPAGEMPEPEYPINYKQGAQPNKPSPDVNKLSSMVPPKSTSGINWDGMNDTEQENSAEQLYQDLVSGNKINVDGLPRADQEQIRRATSNFFNAREKLDMSLDDEYSDRMNDFVVAAMDYDDAKNLAQSNSPVGQPSTPEDPNANLRATPLKKVAAGDYGDTADRPQTTSAVDPFSEEGYYQAFDTLSAGVPSEKFASFIKPYLKNPAAAKSMFSKMIDQSTSGEPDSSGYDTSSSQHNIVMGAGMALKVLRRLEDLKGPNVNSLSSMMPNRTPDQLKDPEDFAKNRQF